MSYLDRVSRAINGYRKGLALARINSILDEVEAEFHERKRYQKPPEEIYLSQFKAALALGISREYTPFNSLWEVIDSLIERGTSNQVEVSGIIVKVVKDHEGVTQVLQDDLVKVKQLLMLNSPRKHNMWKSKREMAEILEISITDQKFGDIWERWTQLARQRRPIIEDGAEVRGQMMLTSTGELRFCIHGYEIPRLLKMLDLDYMQKTDDWFSEVQFAPLLGTAKTNLEYISLWAECARQHQAQEYVELDGRRLAFDKLRGANQVGYYMHKKEVEFCKEKLQISVPKPPEYKSKYEFTRILNTSTYNSGFIELWERLSREYAQKGECVIDGRTIKCGYFGKGARKTFCVHESEKDIFPNRQQSNDNHKTAEWFDMREVQDFHKMNGVAAQLQLREFWQMCETMFLAQKKVEIDGYEAQFAYKTVPKRGGVAGSEFCVAATDLEWLRGAIKSGVAKKSPQLRVLSAVAEGDVKENTKLKPAAEEEKVVAMPPPSTLISRVQALAARYKNSSGLLKGLKGVSGGGI